MIKNNEIEFWAKFEGEFRKDTQMRIDDDGRLLGSILMLNPGKSSPISKALDEDGFQKCIPDPTMSEIKLIMQDYSNFNKGVVKIINLSDVRNSNSEAFLSSSPKFKPLEDITNDIDESEWVWIAWTCRTKNNLLKNLQQDIIKFLNTNKFKILGKNKAQVGYYHPFGIRLMKKDKRIEIENYIKEQFETL